MSDEPKGGFTPRKTRLDVDEWQKIENHVKELLDSSGLKWYIIAAGIGGALEGLHILWLGLLWLSWRLH